MSTAVAGGLPPVTGPTSLGELRARARAAVILRNAGDEVQETQVSGIFYTFQPGVDVEIPDRLEWKRGAKGVLLTNEPKEVLPGADSITIAAEILSDQDNRLGNRGITVMYRDGQDGERIKIARQRYLRYRVARAKTVQREWIYTCEKVTKEPGALPPIQPDSVRAEIAFLARYEAGLVDRKKYICKLDGFETDDRNELLGYIARSYPQQVAAAGGDPASLIVNRDAVVAAAAAPAAAPAPELPTVPPPPAGETTLKANDAAYLIDKADALKVQYTKAELVALLRGDEATLTALAAKVIEAAKRKEAAANV